MKTIIPSHLSDDALVSEAIRLARGHRHTTAQLVAHLAELDTRRLYLGAGFPSLFKYCREVLELSESEAYNRIEAARAARRFPVILDRLADGAVNLTTVRLLARYLTDDNHRDLLAAATRKSKEEVEELVARHFPRPDVPSSIRKLPEGKPAPLPIPSVALPAPDSALPSPAVPAAPPIPPAATRRPVVSALAPDRYEVRFTASASTCEKLRLAKDLLRHAVPTGDLAEIVDRALTALLEDLARKKFAATKRPRHSRGTADGSPHIPAKVQRAVWARDGGRCTFIGKGGRRCNERAFVEYDHIWPRGAKGPSTKDNVRLLCRAHNAYEAELFYGPGKGGGGVVKEPRAPYGDTPRAGLVPERVLHRARGRDQQGGSGDRIGAGTGTEVGATVVQLSP